MYARGHSPSQHLTFSLGLSSTIAITVSLATAGLAFAIAQVITALWVYGKLPWWGTAVARGAAHRRSGGAAFVLSLRAAYHGL